MLNIIQKKIKKYNRILSKGSNYQTHAILFWFNQIVLIFEKLNLEFRCDLNSNNKNMIQKNSNYYKRPPSKSIIFDEPKDRYVLE